MSRGTGKEGLAFAHDPEEAQPDEVRGHRAELVEGESWRLRRDARMDTYCHNADEPKDTVCR